LSVGERDRVIAELQTRFPGRPGRRRGQQPGRCG
jgi:hypothetical protein